MTETTIVHEIAITVEGDYAAVVKRLAEEVVTMAPGTKLVLRYERLVRLHEPLTTAANRLSASTAPTPHASTYASREPRQKPTPKPPKPAAPVPAPGPRGSAPAMAAKRAPTIPERPPDGDMPAFSRVPLRERLMAKRAAEAAT